LIPTILATVVTRVFLPQLARIGQLKSENTQTHLQYLNNILLNIGVLAGLFFYFRAENLTVLAYGQPYRDAAELVALLAITLSLRFGAAYNLYFTLRDMVWLRVLFAIVALTTLITANYLLIPTYGALGAVYASVVTHLVYWIPILVAMRFFEGQALLGWRWLYTLSIAGGYATFLYLSQTLSIWLVSILSVPFTVAVLAYSLPKDTREGLLRSITGAAASKPTSL
jgi:O-antigen/teichoic acid export membrane protein